MISKPQIAAVGGDPGAALALVPVLKRLADDGQANVYVFPYGHAEKIWHKFDLVQKTLPASLAPPDTLNLLEEIKADALVVGTSYNGLMLEHLFIDAASSLSLPSMAVLDFPSNIKARFIGKDGRKTHMPDLIAVDSLQTRNQMLDLGFSENMIKVTGSPAFDDLASYAKTFSKAKRQEIRQVLGVGQDDLMLLFASQPLAHLLSMRKGLLGELGFDEFTVLKLITQALEDIAKESGRKVRMIIRPHPREDPAKFSSLSAKHFDLAVSNACSNWDAAIAADLVAGMNSVLLAEACHLGTIVISVQPGLRLPDPLHTNLSGHSHPVYDPAMLKPVIQGLLLDQKLRDLALDRLKGLKSDGLATARMVELIMKLATTGQ